MIFTYQIEGVTVQTGDIICTMNGKPDILPGEFWRLVGRLVPGDVDHVAIYTGPEGRCIESGTHGVIKFTVFDGSGTPNAWRVGAGNYLIRFTGSSLRWMGLGSPRRRSTKCG